MKVRYILRTVLIYLLCVFAQTAQAQGTFNLALNYSLYDAPPGAEVVLDITADEYVALTAASCSFHYDSEQFQYVGTENYALDDLDVDNFNHTEDNVLTLNWSHPAPFGFTILQAGEALFSIRFQRLADGVPDFYLDGNPMPIGAAYDGDIGGTLVNGVFSYADGSGSLITGNIYNDENDDCLYQNENGLAETRLLVTKDNFSFEVFTSSDGAYEFYLFPGEFELSASSYSNIWTPCSPVALQVEAGNDYEVNIGMQAAVDCERMSVHIATDVITRCFAGQYIVEYCNIGTVLAENPEITVEIDEALFYQSAEITPTNISGNTLTFNVSDIEVGNCGNFWIEFLAGCDDDGVVLGQTHCTTAEITPYETCTDPDPVWDGSSLSITGECVDGEVIFTITNEGADMTQGAEFIVIEDELIMMQEPVNLPAGESMEVPFTANGATYRAEVAQSSGHPGMSMPAFAVEGCGANAEGEFSIGYVTMFPEDDADPNISIFCMENIGSYDPNDKQAFPRGALDEHFIEPNVDLEYLIRFQNTGTAPAVNVVVRDTLSEHLNPQSLRLGAESHPYELEIKDGNILIFKFENIMLPDSASNLAESNGFISFKISQNADLSDGVIIENTAAIYFDFNEPVITNTTFHTIGRDFLEVILDTENVNNQEFSLKVTPNPTSQTALFTLTDAEVVKRNFTLFNATGKAVFTDTFYGSQYIFEKGNLATGMYYFTIGKRSGKLIIQQ